MNTVFFKLIRLGLGLEKQGDTDISLDHQSWVELFKEMQNQALLGIGFDGLQRLPKQNLPPRPLLLQWMAISEQIKRRNRELDDAANSLSRKLDKDGWLFCILKGQTVAQMYPNPAMRQSGDIDVWIYGRKTQEKTSRKAIIRYLEQGGRKVKLCYLHADDITIQGNISVEVHFHPSFSVCPWKNARLQTALSALTVSDCFPASCDLGNGNSIPAATFEFNRLFMLHHIYRHLFSEGIGMRHVVDYAMLLKQRATGIDPEFENTLQKLGLLHFAQGIMWILQHCLNVPTDCLYTSGNKQEGEFLLTEIMRSGNFGQSNNAGMKHDTKWQRFSLKTRRNLSFIQKYPAEVLCYIPFAAFETLAYKLTHR